MLAPGLDGGGERNQRVGAPTAEGDGVGEARLTRRQRARLVEGDRADARGLFHRHATLEQDAAPGGGGDGAQHRCGRRDDECARAGGHHERHGAVEGRAEGVAPEDEGEGDGGERHADHGERVGLLEAVDEALRVGLLRLRVLHHRDDAGDGAVGGGLGHAHVERAAAEGCPAEHLVALGFAHGHALAGQRCLVDLAAPAHDHAVERHPVARQHPEHVADGDLLDGYLDPGAVALDARGVRPELHQRADGPTAPPDGDVLEDVREREQEQQHRPLEGRPDGERAEGCQDHQQVDVGRQVAERSQPGAQPKPPAEDVRDGVERPTRGGPVLPLGHQPAHEADEGEGHEDGLPPPLRRVIRPLRRGARACGPVRLGCRAEGECVGVGREHRRSRRGSRLRAPGRAYPVPP